MRLDVDMNNVGVARRFVRSSFAGLVPHDIVADLVLATSELVTNAFEHGVASSVLLTVRTDGTRASVSVRGATPDDALADVDDWTTAPPDRISGRGLGIVHHVADDIEVVRWGDEVEITVHRMLPGT